MLNLSLISWENLRNFRLIMIYWSCMSTRCSHTERIILWSFSTSNIDQQLVLFWSTRFSYGVEWPFLRSAQAGWEITGAIIITFGGLEASLDIIATPGRLHSTGIWGSWKMITISLSGRYDTRGAGGLNTSPEGKS